MYSVGNEIDTKDIKKLQRRVRICDYLCVAQLFLQDNFLLERPLTADDIKPRLLGHWGSCHGINLAYANLHEIYKIDHQFSFVLGPGHGFPALQANLFLDGALEQTDPRCTRDADGLAYLCRNFSWPGGFPSHSSPATPGVIVEGGELGYALGAAYGQLLGHPEKTTAVLIGDGELETATALASLNLSSLIGGPVHGQLIPILHLNGYKISAPSLYGRKSERELHELIRGFGFSPIEVGEDFAEFQTALQGFSENAFFIMRTEKGAGGPTAHQQSHQIPLPEAKTNPEQLHALETWLKSYEFKLEDLA